MRIIKETLALEAVERRIEQMVGSLEHANITRLYSLMPHGKRLRAKLILHIAGNGIDVVRLAAIVEMIHAASLLHDDVIDDAQTRRGIASINNIYGNKVAIMLGDILYSKGFSELVGLDYAIANKISSAVTLLSMGELDDVNLADGFNTDADIYREMIYKKTASLIEASAFSAAYLAGKHSEVYGKYGKNIGIAFQMIDDLLDITSDSKTLGKPALHDFIEGKMTLPYIYLYHSLDKQGQQKLCSLHKKRCTPEEQHWILQEMQKHSILERCYTEAYSLAKEAIEMMQEAEEEKLVSIAKEMIQRKY